MPAGAWFLLIGLGATGLGAFMCRRAVQQIRSGTETIGQRIFTEVTEFISPVSGSSDREPLLMGLLVGAFGLILTFSGIIKIIR